jgi:hypothetical protein
VTGLGPLLFACMGLAMLAAAFGVRRERRRLVAEERDRAARDSGGAP